MKFTQILLLLLLGAIFVTSPAWAQPTGKPKQVPYSNVQDPDCDGIPEGTGQDKCPTTLSQMEGHRATCFDEISNTEVMTRLPKNLKNYVYHEKTPLFNEQTELRNQLGVVKRELNRIDQDYGKYKDMKKSEKKAEEAKYTAQATELQTKIDDLTEQMKKVNPNTYIEFVGDLLDKEGFSVKGGITFRIRINVDSFGCLPDSDKDGSPDMVDQCPGVQGTPDSGGCPDRDRDGVFDGDDLCPDVKGPKESRGCPDRDKDNIPDMRDDCPDVPGKAELKGCPDRDEDGIRDKDDACPDQKGSPETKGCPDRDEDGIIDREDNCPDEKGIKQFQGCPDRDGDGIMDKEDKCPDVKGSPEFQGCPDTDSDGTPDDKDKCPTVPGPKQNQGCPEILDKASKVLFETGKAIIKTESYSLLDELATMLKKYDDTRIILEGHTDSEGDDAANMKLSKDRAKAVADYLVEKGIDKGRVFSDGFGETKPIADNKTPEGRQKNRRVDMRLTNKKE
jgi:outer membrane protein OmpA-like peptidoglycan-associated protein